MQKIKTSTTIVSRDTCTGQEKTQLLVLKSRQELIFQVAHYNLTDSHMEYDKTVLGGVYPAQSGS